ARDDCAELLTLVHKRSDAQLGNFAEPTVHGSPNAAALDLVFQTASRARRHRYLSAKLRQLPLQMLQPHPSVVSLRQLIALKTLNAQTQALDGGAALVGVGTQPHLLDLGDDAVRSEPRRACRLLLGQPCRRFGFRELRSSFGEGRSGGGLIGTERA